MAQNIVALLREARAQRKWVRPKSWRGKAVRLDLNDQLWTVFTTGGTPIPFTPRLTDLIEDWVLVSSDDVIAEGGTLYVKKASIVRERTGARLDACRAALVDASGNVDRACELVQCIGEA